MRIFEIMRAKVYVSQENLKYNIKSIKEKIGENKEIIAMVKANAYGLGESNVVKILDEIGVKAYGVANVEEAVSVRKVSPESTIIITSVVLDKDEIEAAVENNISMSVSDMENVEDIASVAMSLGKNAKIHIKLDTGMTRLGYTKEDIISNIDKMISLEGITIEGIYTHLSCADVDDEYTKDQISMFQDIVSNLSEKVKFEFIHFLNSDGTLKYTNYNSNYTHVRVGIAMYGYADGLKPISKLTAPILHINEVNSYTKVGYGGTFIAKPGQKIAVVKLGYADGFSRALSNKISINVNGVECAQVGNICMDLFMIDVTNADCKVGDEVLIWDYTNDLKELANLSSKITYEVISTLGKRIERVIE